jgi:hypothetical protein
MCKTDTIMPKKVFKSSEIPYSKRLQVTLKGTALKRFVIEAEKNELGYSEMLSVILHERYIFKDKN